MNETHLRLTRSSHPKCNQNLLRRFLAFNKFQFKRKLFAYEAFILQVEQMPLLKT
uniref:Uncharacterized protein n=1 Tax=Glossina palpalis gambiensis TaxID=67801 RepID=A0A1B0BWD2_9MUSC